MKRYYRKRNGIVFFISIVIIFLYLTTVDWDRSQWGLSGILNIITDYYMPFGNCKRTERGGTVLCASGQATGCLDESVERHLWICCAVLDDGGNHDDSCRRKESVRGF